MKKSLVIALLPIVFLLFGCASNKIEQRLIALEQRVKNTDTKRDQEIEKINRALDEIKEEQANMRAMVAENEIRISQLEPSTTSKRPQKKRQEGAVTFVKESTVFISLGKKDGVRLGNIFGVYTDKKSEEKIASIKITAVDLESSSGEIENKTQDVNVGYFVKSHTSIVETHMKQEKSSAEKSERPAEKRVVVATLATFVSMTDEAIIINHNGEEQTFTITKNTQFINEEGKEVKQEFMSLHKGDEVTVTTEIDGTVALVIRKGALPMRIGS